MSLGPSPVLVPVSLPSFSPAAFVFHLLLDVRGLNLSMSLLPSWEAVASITSELVMLDSLALK